MARRERLILAFLIGLAAGLGCHLRLVQRGQWAADFTFPWRAAQYLIHGQNPYEAIRPEGEFPFQTYFYYPLTAALVALPFAAFPPELAGALFFGLSSGLLAYAVTQEGPGRLPLFVSAPYLVSLSVAQWAPLIVSATLLPWLQWMLVCKPNLGVAGFLYRPTWRGLVGMGAFLGLALLVQPSWPVDWLGVMRSLQGHPPPILILPFGPLLLLALLRWRKPTGRLLLALSLLPQLLFFYDQLLLFLLPRRWLSGLACAGLSWLAYFAWRWQGVDVKTGAILTQPDQYVLALIYLPALALVLWPGLDGLNYKITIWPQ